MWVQAINGFHVLKRSRNSEHDVLECPECVCLKGADFVVFANLAGVLDDDSTYCMSTY